LVKSPMEKKENENTVKLFLSFLCHCLRVRLQETLIFIINTVIMLISGC
jgi:hypothetical protein